MIIIGNNFCLPSSSTIQELFSVARDGGLIPDITMDDTLTSFLSLDSSSALNHQYSSIQQSLSASQLDTFNQGLTSAFGGSTKVTYGGVGVVALALSVLLDVLAHRVKHQGGGGSAATVDHVQRVTGIRNSSRIGSLIGSYLQQVPGLADDAEKMSEVTELYDQGLKYELVDHYERMTNKKRMSSVAMTQWLAGAAFHLHLRVHQIRLGSVPRGSAAALRLSYRTGFTHLVQGYSAYLRRNAQETAPKRAASRSTGPALGPSGTIGPALGPRAELGSVGSGLGLLVLEPFRNVSHSVRHRPCESPAIADALVTRIIAAQDLEQVRDFFQHSEKHFDMLLSQQEVFELKQ